MLFNMVFLDLFGYALFLCVFIPVWVLIMLFFQLGSGTGVFISQSEDNAVEFLWTFLPSLAVSLLCYYNLHCLAQDIFRHTGFVVKVVGRQWYWDYELPVDLDMDCYSSYITDFIDSVDKPLRLFYGINYALVFTSGDVIHSFSVPSLNIKMDAVPGRLNEVYFTGDRLGVFIGYCSELCGAGHAYMPIVIEVVHPICRISGVFGDASGGSPGGVYGFFSKFFTSVTSR